jgi:hypothetical protein
MFHDLAEEQARKVTVKVVASSESLRPEESTAGDVRRLSVAIGCLLDQ